MRGGGLLLADIAAATPASGSPEQVRPHRAGACGTAYATARRQPPGA